MKKILIVASPWLGGSGSVAYRHAKYLTEREDFEVHFLSYSIPFKKSLGENIKFHKVNVLRYPLFPFPLEEIALAEEIVKVCKKENIKIVHAHYGILFGHAAVLAKNILSTQGIKIRVILTFHGSDVIGFDLKRPGKVLPVELNRWAIASADEITVASENLRNHLLKIHNINRPVSVIPNAIDTEKFAPSSNKYTKPTLIHISNFRKVKQPMLVIKIFEGVTKKMKSAQLILIGDGPEKIKVLDYVKAKKIPGVIALNRLRSEKKIINYLSKSHLLLLPSTFENFPLSALEAQACGVPVIASNAGGIPEVILDGLTGKLSDTSNLSDYIKNCVEVLSNKVALNTLNNNSRKNALQYDEKRILKLYEDLYNEPQLYSSISRIKYSFLNLN